MPDEPDPQLSLATVEDLFDELERRFPDYVFAGRGTTLHDGRNGFILKAAGFTDMRVGLIQRLGMLERTAMRRELRDARHLDEDGDEA